MINAEQIKLYRARLKALYSYLDIEKKQMFIEDEQGLTHDPNFWDDPKKASKFWCNLQRRKELAIVTTRIAIGSRLMHIIHFSHRFITQNLLRFHDLHHQQQ